MLSNCELSVKRKILDIDLYCRIACLNPLRS